MRMCTVAAMPPFDAMKVAALTASNCRETVSLFANYTSSMETVETPLDLPLALPLTCFVLALVTVSLSVDGGSSKVNRCMLKMIEAGSSWR